MPVDGIAGRELVMYDGSPLIETLVKVDKTERVLSYSIKGLPFGVESRKSLLSSFASKARPNDFQCHLAADGFRLFRQPPADIAHRYDKVPVVVHQRRHREIRRLSR